MKHNKSIFVIAIIAALGLLAPAAKANDEKNSLPVELKLLGSVKNQPLIELSFTGSRKENEFSITISDQNGVVLYSSNEKGEIFSKQFLLDTEDLGDAILKFDITGKKSGRSVSYRVSRRSVTVNNMDVVRL